MTFLSYLAAMGLALSLAVPACAQGEPPALDLKAVALTAELFTAIHHGDKAATIAALDHGADPNRPNWIEMMPLDWAVMLGKRELATILLQRGAKQEGGVYGTPVISAVLMGREADALALLDGGASPLSKRPDSATTLMLAAAYGTPKVIDRLKPDAAELAKQDIDGATALIYAARLGQVEATKRLLARHAPIDQADRHGRTPLMYAAMNGYPEVVKLLLAQGAKVGLIDTDRATALHLAARYSGSPEVVKSLLAAKSPLAGRDATGKTPLALAQARRHTEVVRALQQAGARPEPVAALPAVRPAVQKSLVAMESGMKRFLKLSQCAACHHQGLGLAVLGYANLKGFAVDKSVVQDNLKRIGDIGQQSAPLLQLAASDPKMVHILPTSEMDEFPITASYLFWALDANGVPANPGLGGLAQYVAGQQRPAGNWHFTLHRGPMQESLHTATAFQILGMKRFLEKDQSAASVTKAREWFQTAAVATTEDRATRLLGLRWSGVTPKELQTDVQKLIALQHPDGGWGNTPRAKSDPMTTGLALYSLRAAGNVATTASAVRKAADYLLRTQDESGAWYVNKTTPPFNYFFDMGFPGGESQYISFAATGWATLALMEIGA